MLMVRANLWWATSLRGRVAEKELDTSVEEPGCVA